MLDNSESNGISAEKVPIVNCFVLSEIFEHGLCFPRYDPSF